MDHRIAIEVQGLVKSFGEMKAVDGVSFEVRQGEIFSLLGPNGAGKTTTISMLSCLLRPDEGDACVMGHSIRTEAMGVKSALGVVPQELALYEDLTARENLNFWGKMYGLRGRVLRERVDEVLDVIGLRDRAKERVGKYSGGMKRRVNIGVALLHKPQVIYMDEPTVGIDPQSRRNILDSVVALKQQGMTVLYTTHYMEEAQELSDFIAIMDHGKLIASRHAQRTGEAGGPADAHRPDGQRGPRQGARNAGRGSRALRMFQGKRSASSFWRRTATWCCRACSRPPRGYPHVSPRWTSASRTWRPCS